VLSSLDYAAIAKLNISILRRKPFIQNGSVPFSHIIQKSLSLFPTNLSVPAISPAIALLARAAAGSQASKPLNLRKLLMIT
jgi:hypothetical protein